MNHKFGVHWINAHGRPADHAFVRDLQPLSIKLVAGDVPDVQWVSDAHRAAPNALIVLRSHAMSEQKDDQRLAPQATGVRHAHEWRKHVDKLRAEANRRGISFPSDDRLIILGINEPVLDAPGDLSVDERIRQMKLRAGELNAYTVAMCDKARQLGLTVGALNLSVGWPTNWDLPGHPRPGALSDWSLFAEAGASIKRGGHYLFLHEYWADRGPEENRTWWAQRYTQCPWTVPIIIGEAGIDMYVKDGGVSLESRGWLGRFSPDEYVAQIRRYHESCMVDSRIHSIQIYTSDYSHPWHSFDLLDAYPALLAYARTQVGEPHTYEAWTGYITAEDGLNMRQLGSTTSAVIRAVPYGQAVQIVDKVGDWYKVEHSGAIGYMSAQYISRQAPTKPTTQYGDDFARAIAFVLREEGGLVDNPADPGGLTNWGISQAAYPNLNIRNLTREQAMTIYFTDYWQRSGADKLPWPLNVVVFDSAVNAGVGMAQRWLNESGGNAMKVLAKRLMFYTGIGTWAKFGMGWTRRMSRLLELAA